MLFASVTPGTPGLGDISSDLADLKKRIDGCIRSFPLSSGGNVDADILVTCEAQVDGELDATQGIRAFEKLTLLDDKDNALMFDVARTLLSLWRNTGMGGKPTGLEARTRRIAAQKLGEQPVYDAVSPTLAVQTLSSAGRIETDESVLTAIIPNLALIMADREIPDNIRTEALTTLKILADPLSQHSAGLTVTAQEALKVAQAFSGGKPTSVTGKPITIDIGPAVVTPIETRSKFAIPIIVTAVTAVVATGVLWAIFRRRPTYAHAISAPGPLRRRVEAQLRRRRAR